MLFMMPPTHEWPWLWEAWRQTHPTPGPILSGSDRVMDPWAESYDDLLNLTALGYAYDSLAL